jgi:hypothetical protein
MCILKRNRHALPGSLGFLNRIFSILFPVAAHFINVIARMSTNGLENINQIELDFYDEMVYHATRTQGCGGFKLYYVDNIIYITC